MEVNKGKSYNTLKKSSDYLTILKPENNNALY